MFLVSSKIISIPKYQRQEHGDQNSFDGISGTLGMVVE